MAGASLSVLAGLLKRIQSGEVVDMQNLDARAMDEIAKSAKKYNAGGQGFYGAINDYGNEAVGAINETEQFRSIDNEDYQQYVVQPKVLVGPVQITGLAAEAADSDEEAFAEAVLKEVQGAKKRLRKDMNRQFFGAGLGYLGNPAAALASNLTSFTVATAQYFRKNMVIDGQSQGVDLSIRSNRILNVDKVNNIIYLTNSLQFSMLTTDNFSKENVRQSASSSGKEMMGLNGIIDDSTTLTTFQNLSAASLYEWRGVIVNASSANLTSDLLQRVLDDPGTLGGQDPDTLITHKIQRRKYLDLVVPEKRFSDLKLDAGFQKLSFNGIELWLDVDCQNNQVYAISKNRIYRFEVSPLSMGGLDGSDTWLRSTNFDQFQAYWKYYGNFGTDKRNAHAKITNLAVPTGIS